VVGDAFETGAVVGADGLTDPVGAVGVGLGEVREVDTGADPDGAAELERCEPGPVLHPAAVSRHTATATPALNRRRMDPSWPTGPTAADASSGLLQSERKITEQPADEFGRADAVGG
jgi:hypothetical protein